MAASQQNAEGAPMLPQLKHTLANLAHRVHAGAQRPQASTPVDRSGDKRMRRRFSNFSFRDL